MKIINKMRYILSNVVLFILCLSQEISFMVTFWWQHNITAVENIKKLYFLAPAVLSALRGEAVDVDPHLLTTDRTCLHAC
jgi:hypothetical protein